jgi:hypothetical protein
LRIPLTFAGAASLVVAIAVDAPAAVRLAGMAVLLVGLALYVRLGTPISDAIDIAPPVGAGWRAFNSPASRVPSHGLHAWGQTYAVDLVYDPEDDTRPGTGWWPLARRPVAFPGFGQPIQAPVSGEVVRAVDRARDHLSRTSPFALAYLVLESVRELAGPLGVLGNHVVIREPGGRHVLLAHLRRHSVRVRPGQVVAPGDIVAACGNSGNSSEPHLHLQVMDRPSAWVAAGLPFTIQHRTAPRNGQMLVGRLDDDR